MNKEKTAQQLLNEAVDRIDEAIADAIEIANEHGLSFTIEPSYGMGGTFYSFSEVIENDYLQEYYDLDPSEGGWVASSQTC